MNTDPDRVVGDDQFDTASVIESRRQKTLLKTNALQDAIFSSAYFSSIATDEKGVIQIFNVGAERMLGYAAADVVNKITPAEISDPQELIARAIVLSLAFDTHIAPGFEALAFKAARGIEDIYDLTYIRKDGTRFPALVSVTSLRDADGSIIGYLLIGTDSTARKQAEEALLKTSALQDAIFNSAYFSSIATDEKGVIQIFNVGAERMLGYAAADIVNKITPASLSDPQELIARAAALSLEFSMPIAPGFEALVFKAARGIEDIYELTKIRKDGSRFAAIVSVTALRDSHEQIIGYLLIGTDNTARKQVEAAKAMLDQHLRDQQFYTRSLIESNIDALIVTDSDGIISDVNQKMMSLTGQTRDELIGAPCGNFFTDQQRAEAAIKRVLIENNLSNYELTVRNRNGNETPISYNAATLYDRNRNLLGVFAAARDITERKEAEAKIERASRALQTLSQCNEALIRTSTEPELLAKICDIAVLTGGYKMAWVGYAMQDSSKLIVPKAKAGHDAGFLESLPFTWSPDEKFGRGPAGDAVRTGLPVAIADFSTDANFSPWLDEARSRGYAGVISLPLRNEDRVFGLLVLYTSAIHEISPQELHLMQQLADDLAFGITALRTREERAQAYQEIEHLNAELEQRVQMRTVQLVAANLEMESFSYTISHDLRSPLRSMEGFSSAVLTDFGSLLPPEGRRSLERIKAGALRMSLLIDDLLAFSQTSRQELRRKSCDTLTLVQDVLDSLATDYPSRETQVQIDALPAFYGDVALIRQVWTNLISNALKYSAKKATPLIEVGWQDAGDEQVFFVRDNGAGFDMSYANKLFGVFQRLHTEKEFTGTGAGLAIVKRIVERHGGRVWAESVEHEGATFYFTLPKELKIGVAELLR